MQQAQWDSGINALISENLKGPKGYVHRDFMPRNLMMPLQPLNPTTSHPVQTFNQIWPLGVLDFQDAVYGPLTYDIASLMRDAFLSWEEDEVIEVTVRYWEAARRAQLPLSADFGEFYRAVEWMGLQRHLKVMGIFARIYYRDGKPAYLNDTPRFVKYALHTTKRYRELAPLYLLINGLESEAANSIN